MIQIITETTIMSYYCTLPTGFSLRYLARNYSFIDVRIVIEYRKMFMVADV